MSQKWSFLKMSKLPKIDKNWQKNVIFVKNRRFWPKKWKKWTKLKKKVKKCKINRYCNGPNIKNHGFAKSQKWNPGPKTKSFLDTVTYFFKNHVFAKILKNLQKNWSKPKKMTFLMKILVRISTHLRPDLTKVKKGHFWSFPIRIFQISHESCLEKNDIFSKKWKNLTFLSKNVIFSKNPKIAKNRSYAPMSEF